MTRAVKIPKFNGNRVFCCPGGALQFSKFHGNEAKYYKHNFKRGLTVAFKVKNS